MSNMDTVIYFALLAVWVTQAGLIVGYYSLYRQLEELRKEAAGAGGDGLIDEWEGVGQ